MTNDYGNLELQKVLLQAMKDIDKICRENGLKYYLYAGTLLGAINHKGFIPWDDDVDIVMFPDDFQKFCNIIRSQFAGIYEICGYETDLSFYTKMNALRVLGTRIYCERESHEIFLDIQVLHSIPDSRINRFFQRKCIEILNQLTCVHTGRITPTSLRSKIFWGLFKNVSREEIGRKLDKVMSWYDEQDTKYVGIMCNTMTRNPYTGKSGYETDITKRDCHIKYQYIPFEDVEFMTISEAEKDLVHRYGPCWNDTYPEEKRITRHGMKSYEISEIVRRRVGI